MVIQTWRCSDHLQVSQWLAAFACYFIFSMKWKISIAVSSHSVEGSITANMWHPFKSPVTSSSSLLWCWKITHKNSVETVLNESDGDRHISLFLIWATNQSTHHQYWRTNFFNWHDHVCGAVCPCLNRGLWALARVRPQARAGGTER